MTLFFRLILLLALLVTCSLGPGTALLRRARWRPIEKLAVAIGVSLVFIYLAALAIYSLGLPSQAYWAVSALCAVAGVYARKDFYQLWRSPGVRHASAAFAMLYAWGFAWLLLIRHYSGGGWAGDWLEHYQRALFWIERWPTDSLMIGLYPLPARPPLMNLVVGHFLAQAGTSFELYQATCLFLNLLVFWPCWLFARRWAGRNRFVALCAFTLLLAGNPLVMENITWTWTKLLTAFFVLLALWLFLRRPPSVARGAIGGLFLAAGLLTHYSAGPYVAVIAICGCIGLIRFAPRRRQIMAAAIVAFALAATWFAWSYHTYGPRATLMSNSVATDASPSLAGRFVTSSYNVWTTLIPHPLRPASSAAYEQHSLLGTLRDYVFLIYQTNLIFAMGSIGGPLVIYLLARSRQAAWIAFVVACAVVGIGIYPERDAYGVAQICLQPLVLLGVALLAANFARLPLLIRRIFLAGVILDFVLGVLMQMAMEHRVFSYITRPDGSRGISTAVGLSAQAATNWEQKMQAGVTFLGDHVQWGAVAMEAGLAALFIVAALWLAGRSRSAGE